MREAEAAAIVEAMRAEKTVARRRRTWGKSKLMRFRPELVQLRRAGASLEMLVEHLRKQHRCKVERSTVMRFLQKLPELANGAAS